MAKAPSGRVGTGANPTGRGKKDAKRSMLTDGKGMRLDSAAVVITICDIHCVMVDTYYRFLILSSILV